MRAYLIPLWGLLLGLCLWIYWPGLSGPSLLDDGANLVTLEQLDESPFLLQSVVLGNTSGPLGRPVSMLSFALERMYLDGGVQGSKLVNLCLHLLTACCLLLFARDLYNKLGYSRPAVAAVAVAALWLFAPLLLSTVLYSIQRMAQLSALFSLLCIWSYLRFRISRGIVAAVWFALSLVTLVIGVLSKENALLAVPLVLLLEWKVLCYQSSSSVHERLLRLAHGSVFAGGILLVLAVAVFSPGIVLDSYAYRDFTLGERLLTQVRILWTYVGQLLWVDQARLGIYQDTQVLSRSLLEPMTTLLAMFAWLGVGLMVVIAGRSREAVTVAFGVGFFIVAHAMESSVISLELYFEHRNYLPAMGLFIALVGAGYWLIERREWSLNWLLLLLVLATGRSVAVVASEAMIWSNPYLMHFVMVNRFPDSVRTNSEMARALALAGDVDSALRYSRRVVQLDGEGDLRHQLRDLVLHCMARPAISGEVISSLSASAADFRDDGISEKAYILVKQVVDGRCPETRVEQLADRMHQLTMIAQPSEIAPKVYLSLAILENHIERYPQALDYVEALLMRSPGNTRALLMKLYFASVLELEREREQSLAELLHQQEEGRLSQEQEYNLSLFVEPAEDLLR
jgi:hypothetical protein